MTLEQRLVALAQAVGLDVKALFSRALPTGGTQGQVLAKNSAADGDASWQAPAGGGSGQTAPQARAQNYIGL